jgi:alanyl aminopeptidase
MAEGYDERPVTSPGKLLLLSLVSSFACGPPAASLPGLRLPASPRPTRYAVELSLDPAADAFDGVAEIDVTLDAPAETIWLNATELTIAEATLDGAALAVVAPAGDDQHLALRSARAASPGAHKLKITYRGKVSPQATIGVYRADEDGASYLASSFEWTYARRAFPCWDDPGLKVPWQLTLRVPRGQVALSNTPVVEERDEPDGRTHRVVFAETPPLPSYLVAFAVGPFELVEAGVAGVHRTPVRVIAPRGRGAETAWAAQIAPELLKRLEAYFDVPYPYPKLDLVALPRLGWSGMENAGMISFGARAILADPRAPSEKHKRDLAILLAHEMAHQWFGDFVTLAWWNDTWLNEGFATWMSFRIVGEWRPEWHAHAVFLDEERAWAMNTDAQTSARAIRQPIATLDDVANAFDAITYSKGASILVMLERWIGPDKFRAGIHAYLARHGSGSAVTADFVAAMSEAAGRDVAPIFAGFLDRPGLPLVTVGLECPAGRRPRVTLAQERFLTTGARSEVWHVSPWQLPVCVRAGNARACTFMTGPHAELELDGACPAWVLADEGGFGYYRARYPSELLAKLFDSGARAALDEEDRLALVLDAKALVVGGLLPAEEILPHLEVLAADPSPRVALAAAGLALELFERVTPHHERVRFRALLRATFGARARRLGWRPAANEDVDELALRRELLLLVSDQGGDDELRGDARALAGRLLDGEDVLAPDVRQAALNLAALDGDAALFERFRGAARAAHGEARRELLEALLHFRDPSVRAQALALLLTPEVGTDEILHLLNADDGDGLESRWAFVKAHWDELVRRAPEEWASQLVQTGNDACTVAARADVAEFLRERAPRLTGGPRALAHALEKIDQCISVRAVEEPSVARFLAR